MNDDELRRLLRNTLGGRRAPEDVKERILARLRGRPAGWIAAAAVLALAAALVVLPRGGKGGPPEAVAAALEQHFLSDASAHAASASTSREVSGVVGDVLNRVVELPGLRDAGLSPLDVHRCASMDAAHVIYSNSWLKLSCFILPSERIPPSGGTRIFLGGVEGALYTKGKSSALAVRAGSLVKLWVADLRPEQLAAIALDAEQKRDRLQTTVLNVPGEAVRSAGAILLNTPGVEDCRPEPSGEQVSVTFDQRRVSADEIAAVLVLNGIQVTPRDGEGR
jgi:hypothetical protein